MKNALAKQVATLVIPMLLGAAGAWVATSMPAVHTAFCMGK